MSGQDLKKPSETNWARVNEMTDDEIDTSDIPPLAVDAEVLEWFKAQGEDFRNRINAALKIYAEAHKEQRR